MRENLKSIYREIVNTFFSIRFRVVFNHFYYRHFLIIFNILIIIICILIKLNWVSKILNIFKRVKDNGKFMFFLNKIIKKVNSISFAIRNQKICRISIKCINSVSLAIKYFLIISNKLLNYDFALFTRLICFIYSLYSETLWNLISSSIFLWICYFFFNVKIYYLIQFFLTKVFIVFLKIYFIFGNFLSKEIIQSWV